MGNVGVRYLMIAAGNRCFAPLFLCPLRLFPLVSFVSSYSVYNPRVASDCPATMLRSFDKSQSLKMTRKSSPKRTLRREKVEEEEELELIECRANNVDMDMDDDYEAQNKALEEMLEKDKKDLVEQAEQIMENKKKVLFTCNCRSTTDENSSCCGYKIPKTRLTRFVDLGLLSK